MALSDKTIMTELSEFFFN